MYKLLLVDDEPDILYGMAKSIPWERWGFSIIGQASDGLEAMKLIRKEQPHVVLSDIRMPHMDGVALMEELNGAYPEIKIIILSGYSDFEYLQVAIKNQVAEYLLKPTDLDQFEGTFMKIREQLDKERKKEEEVEDLRQQAHEAKGMQYARILNELLQGYVSNDNYLKLDEALGISFQNCITAVLNIQQTTDIPANQGDRMEVRQQIIEYCNSRETEYKSFFFEDYTSEVTAVIEISMEADWKSLIFKYFQELQSEIQDIYGIELSAGVSDICRQVSSIFRSHDQAVTSSKQKIFLGSLSIVFYPDLEQYGKNVYEVRSFEPEKIKQYLVRQDLESLEEELSCVLMQFKDKMLKDYSYIDRLSLEILYHISRWGLANYQIRLEELMENGGYHYNDIYRLVSLKEKEGFLLIVLGLLAKEIHSGQKDGKIISNLAQVVKDYVDKEYCSNFISLDFVGEKVQKNSAYLSKLFKRETGFKFSDYITQKRMAKGRELLLDPALKIYEIAEMTGYADVSNFIKVFRKNCGVSPNEYRNIHGRTMIQ